MGNAFWELFCMERGIQPNGELQQLMADAGKPTDDNFSVTGSGKHVPR